jgi:hypothetical protein
MMNHSQDKPSFVILLHFKWLQPSSIGQSTTRKRSRQPFLEQSSKWP